MPAKKKNVDQKLSRWLKKVEIIKYPGNLAKLMTVQLKFFFFFLDETL